MRKLIVAGPIIIEDGKLILSREEKGDDFYKIPGGKVKEGESLQETIIREFKEETGMECEVFDELVTEVLIRDIHGEKMNVELHNFRAQLKNKPKNFESYNYNGHNIRWFNIDKVKKGGSDFSPNIKFLVEKGAIK